MHFGSQYSSSDVKKMENYPHISMDNSYLMSTSDGSIIDGKKYAVSDIKVLRNYIPVCNFIHTYIHTYLNTYIHTYVHTYIHIHTYTYMYIHSHAYVMNKHNILL